MRRAAVVALVAFLAVPVVAGQTGGLAGEGPRRTGAIPFEGPQTNDTAFQVQLPGTPVLTPVIEGGVAYVATDDYGYRDDLTAEALWRIDLGTASVERVMEFPAGHTPLKLTSDLMLFEDRDDLVALEVPSGDERFRTRVFADDPTVTFRDYMSPARVGDTIYTGVVAEVSPPGHEEDIAGAAAVDAETGELLWSWRRRSRGDLMRAAEGGESVPREFNGLALSTDGERVYLYTRVVRSVSAPGVYDERMQYQVWGIEDGQALWNRSDTEQQWTYAGPATVDPGEGRFCCSAPPVTESQLLTRLDAVQALNPVTGETIWDSPVGRSDRFHSRGAKALGVRGDAFVATSSQTVYRFDAATGDLNWMRTVPSPSRIYSVFSVTLDEDTAYIPTIVQACDNEGQGIEARDLDTGDLRWRWHDIPDFPGGDACFLPIRPAFGPGVMVTGVKDGTVSVVGRTGASLGTPQVGAPSYPDIGETVTLDVADVAPGALGPATRYRIFWGDGTVSGWQDGTTFTHAYDEPGNVTARIQAGNAANQTASTTQTFHVGQSPPEQLNFMQRAFAPKNQDLTFGVLGLAVALAGGAWGVARRRRKRSRLQEELAAIEQVYEETRDRPPECEAQLTERKTHARGLMLDGVLTEEQFGVVERRIEELRGELRVSVLDDRFAFLPHGMVRTLQRMLADGKINAWERETLMQALEDEDVLTGEQKAKVERLIDRWFERDAGPEPSARSDKP